MKFNGRNGTERRTSERNERQTGYILNFDIKPTKRKKTFQDEEGRPCYNLKTAAQKLGWSPVTLRARLLDGSIFGNKIGRKWLIPASKIERLLTEPKDEDGKK